MIEKYLKNRFLTLYLIPFILGSLTIFSFEPFNIIIINFLVFPLFFYLLIFINKKTKSIYRKKSYKINFFIFGLAFGFGFYLCGLHWITNSLTFDENFKILIPFALVLIPLFLSLFIGLVALIIGPYLKLNFSSLLIFSASLALSDYLRTYILTGFPWNVWAYSTTFVTEILQIINSIGLYSYNLFVITIFTSPIIIFFKTNKIKKFLSLSFTALFVFGLYIYGNYKINKNKDYLESGIEKTNIKIISPNFDLQYDLSFEDIENRFRKLIRYSNPNKQKKTLFIWPEGVLAVTVIKKYQFLRVLF